MIARGSRSDLAAYRRIVMEFSGGKDSLAMLLMLLDLGVPQNSVDLQVRW